MRMPSRCPSCGGPILVTRMECSSCDAVVEGKFTPCPVCALDEEARRLFDVFMRSRGNLKEIERELGLSYPTVRSKIERMFEQYEKSTSSAISRMEVLKMLREGKISVSEAEEMLRS